VVVGPTVYGESVVTSVLSAPIVTEVQSHDYSIETATHEDFIWVEIPNPAYNPNKPPTGNNTPTIKVKQYFTVIEWRVWDNLTTTTTHTVTQTDTTSTPWSIDTTTTPWTKTDTTTTTVQRHGSPQGNGAIISTVSVVTTTMEYGTPVITTETGVKIESTSVDNVTITTTTEKVPVQVNGNQGWNPAPVPATWP